MEILNSGDSVEVSNISSIKKPDKKGSKGSKPRSSVEDGKVGLSSESKLLSKVVEIAKSTDLSQEEKVKMIKAKIQSGEYKMDYSKVADEIIREHLF